MGNWKNTQYQSPSPSAEGEDLRFGLGSIGLVALLFAAVGLVGWGLISLL